MKINFIYSDIYERTINPNGTPMDAFSIRIKKNMINRFWKMNSTKIERAFHFYFGKEFKYDIDCYITGSVSISNPLSVSIRNMLGKIRKDANIQDTLVHELCHVVLSHNNVENTKKYKQFLKDFKDENPVTRIHILIHAMHYLVAKELFPRRLKNIVSFSKQPDYKRSWEIVMKIGAREIIEKYL